MSDGVNSGLLFKYTFPSSLNIYYSFLFLESQVSIISKNNTNDNVNYEIWYCLVAIVEIFCVIA